jgi:predicted ArsR family transcriptional regulator
MQENQKNIEEILREQRDYLEARHLQHTAVILEEIKNRFGLTVYKIIEEVQGRHLQKKWAAIAKKEGKNQIDDLIRLLWEPLRADGLEYEVRETAQGIQIRCTKCPAYNIARECGTTIWGYHLICSNDYYIVEGFNPRIGFRRTKTLMEGFDCCDHFYYLKSDVEMKKAEKKSESVY